LGAGETEGGTSGCWDRPTTWNAATSPIAMTNRLIITKLT
jgi:hypothetical protein